MAEKSRQDLKTYFQSGKRPTGQQFADLIDSVINKLDDGMGVDGNNNVGVGTTNPGAILDVKDQDGTIDIYRATDPTGQHRWRLNSGFDMFLTDNTGQDTVKIGQNSSWFNGGNVGIGTINPIAKIHINGNVNIESSHTLEWGIGFEKQANAGEIAYQKFSDALDIVGAGIQVPDRKIKFWAEGGSIFNGNVGIGNIDPSERLHINGNLKFNSEYNNILFPEKSGYSGGITGDDFNYKRLTLFHGHSIALQTGANDPDHSKTNLYINANGNVGIGITSPSSKMHVRSNAVAELSTNRYDSNLIIEATDNHRSTDYGASLGFVLPANTDGSNPWQQGRVLVTPDNESNANASGRMYLQTRYYNTGSWDWRNNLVLLSSGNMGINISTPSAKLHINGNVKIESDHTLELGSGFEKEGNAGKIAYQKFSDALDIVGAGLQGPDRKIKFWAEGGSIFNGNVGIGNIDPSERLHINGNLKFNSEYNNILFPEKLGYSGGITGDDFQYKRLTLFHGHSIALQTGTNDPDHSKTNLYINANGNVGIGTTNPTQKLHVVGDALKTAGGTAWQNPSDKRLKKDIKPFTDSLEMLKQVQPVTYRYNGKGGIQESGEEVGVIAQEIREVFPYMVSAYKARLNESDTEDSDILSFNGSALKFVMLNAIKELDKRLAKIEKKEHSG